MPALVSDRFVCIMSSQVETAVEKNATKGNSISLMEPSYVFLMNRDS
jgi:hypothetical protein